MAFGSYLRTVRERARVADAAFSLRKVAQRVGVEPAYLSKVERGDVAPPSEDTIRLRPQLFADLLRQLRDAPDHAILRLVREVRDGDW